MITVAFLLIAQVLLVAGIGHWSLSKLYKVQKQHIEWNMLFGLGIVGVLGNLISIFIPLNGMVKGTVFIIGLTTYADKSTWIQFKEYADRFKETGMLERISFTLLSILAILLAAGPIIRDDTESYHLQSILWLNEYGTVPGLANLHTRLGFNSSWLQSISLLTPLTKYNFYTTPNTLLSIAVASAAIIQTDNESIVPKNKQRMINLGTMLIMFSIWYYWRGNIQSCNYDYYFTAAALIFYFQLNQEAVNKNYAIVAMALIPPILCSIRLIYLPSLIFTVYALNRWRENSEYKIIAQTIFFIIITLGAHLYRSYVLSGHPLYPSNFLTLSYPDWQIPEEHLHQLMEYIRNFSRPRDLDFLDSFKTWIHDMYLYEKAMVGIGLLGLIIKMILRLSSKNKMKKQALYFHHCVLIFISTELILWYYISPEPRFIAGIFFIGQAQLIKYLTDKLSITESSIKYIAQTVGISLCISLCIVLFKKLTTEKSEYANIYLPKKIDSPETRNFIWENTLVRIPEKINNNWNSRCYLTPLPCAYDSLPGIKMKSRNIKDGFYAEQHKKRKLP